MQKKSSLFLKYIIKSKGRDEMSLRKPALREQQIFLPELLSDSVESGPHAARFFLYLAETLNLKLYRKPFLGTPPYSRPILLAVILYSMYKGVFESQNIVQFAGDSIGVQWLLNGMNMPKYKTVQRTINAFLEELDDVFIQILSLCEQMGLIGGERAYTDGVKVQANASKHKAMSYGHLEKKIARKKEDLKELFAALREIADVFDLPDNEFKETALEDASDLHKGLQKIHRNDLRKRQEKIFNKDFDETECQSGIQLGAGEDSRIDELKTGLNILGNIEPAKHGEAMEILNNIAFASKRATRMEDAKSELEDRWKALNGNKKIPETQQINFTDPDSGIMTTKHHGVQQCYNNFAIIDDKANIILGCYSSNNPIDQVSLRPCIERTEQLYGSLEGFQFGADAGFFSADNILYAKSKGIDFYASYPKAEHPYAKDKFKYNEEADIYTCPAGNALLPPKESRGGKLRTYRNVAACKSCEKQSDCTKAKDGVRRINRDMVEDKLREEAREKADSAEGREILRLRKSIPEPVWGNIKTQDDFIQMHFRGIDKASLEFELHCLIQNIRKLLKVYFKSKSYQDFVHNKFGGCCKAA
jgi:transposase